MFQARPFAALTVRDVGYQVVPRVVQQVHEGRRGVDLAPYQDLVGHIHAYQAEHGCIHARTVALAHKRRAAVLYHEPAELQDVVDAPLTVVRILGNVHVWIGAVLTLL